jgi:hypothetical protein
MTTVDIDLIFSDLEIIEIKRVFESLENKTPEQIKIIENINKYLWLVS